MLSQDIRLPAKARKKKKESQAQPLYGVSGRTDYHMKQPDILPVGLDAEAMEQLIKERLMKDQEAVREKHEESLEQMMLPQSNGLPPGPPLA